MKRELLSFWAGARERVSRIFAVAGKRAGSMSLSLLVVALIGVSLAFATKPSAGPSSLHRWNFWQRSSDGTKYFTTMDLSAVGWTKGIDYECISPVKVCTFLADPAKLHTDLTGMWFYRTDIPTAGVDSTGYFNELNW